MEFKFEIKFRELLKKATKTKEESSDMQKFKQLFEQELNEEVKELSEELKKVGSHYTDIWEMVNTKDTYPEAIDILINHLGRDYHEKNKEGIVRALMVKEAKGKANKALIREYENTPKEKDTFRWVIGGAIATTMTRSDVDWIISTVLDKSNKMSRGELVVALGTVKSEKVENVLISLLDDDYVAPQAICALGMLKSQKAKELIQDLLRSSNSLVRLEAQKAIKKINK